MIIVVVSEISFNVLMIIYLIQPYREAKEEGELQPNRAVRVIAGRETFLSRSTNNLAQSQQDVPPDYEDDVIIHQADRNAFDEKTREKFGNANVSRSYD